MKEKQTDWLEIELELLLNRPETLKPQMYSFTEVRELVERAYRKGKEDLVNEMKHEMKKMEDGFAHQNCNKCKKNN